MVRVVVALALAVLASCSPAPESPDAQVRAALAAIEAAAGARDVDALAVHVSDRYGDASGNDKRALLGVAALHFVRNQAVYTLTRIQSLELPEPGRADVRVLAALAGRPIPDAAALAALRADLYRFDVTLSEEEPGTWRISAARWQPATLSDFR